MEKLVLVGCMVGLGVLLVAFMGVGIAAMFRNSRLNSLTLKLGAALCCYIAFSLVVGGILRMAGGS